MNIWWKKKNIAMANVRAIKILKNTKELAAIVLETKTNHSTRMLIKQNKML